jgi:hypothetical protein
MAKKSKESKDEWNIEGTTLSYLLCNLENQCLQNLVSYCQMNGVKISSLIFDGLMVYKETVEDIDSLCKQLQENLKALEVLPKLTQEVMDKIDATMATKPIMPQF